MYIDANTHKYIYGREGKERHVRAVRRVRILLRFSHTHILTSSPSYTLILSYSHNHIIILQNVIFHIVLKREFGGGDAVPPAILLTVLWYANTYKYKQIHTTRYTYTQAINTYKHRYTKIHMQMYIWIHINTHKYTYVRIDTHKHIHTCT